MRIEKYKFIANGKYKILIEGEEYIIYEDVIIQNNLLAKKEITKEELDNFLDKNSYYEAYYKGLKYIKVKMRAKKEIEKYLLKSSYSQDIISKVVEKLEKDNYINDDKYVQAYINDQINLKLVGPYKIEKDLLKLDIPKDIIKKHLMVFTEEIERDKINKYIEKEKRVNSNKSNYMFKNKVLFSLVEKGFRKEIVISCLDDITIDDKEIYEKEYKKIYDKLSKKYNGKELEYKVKAKMYQKGFVEK